MSVQRGPRDVGASPADLVAEACDVLGARAVVAWCADLLSGEVTAQEALDVGPPLTWLGGRAAVRYPALDAEQLAVNAYWIRVWGARGLLHVWDDSAAPAIVTALSDEHWRVREKAAAVVATHEVAGATEAVGDLLTDDVPRVRVAAARALAVVGEAEQAVDLDTAASHDPEVSVRDAAERALQRLARRLGQPVDVLLDAADRR